ncbi:BON domain-containing protein [Pseudodesulfovibrio sp. zrk46]|uniref:BON domain-containing protein n=1 Tax=Pseudodesulfovibrio sp. zrk46 TaxID=2725288 RepID=UPI0014490BFE|nr:BON domain-containing protein [Pseudodesulfovibrio sp. zrk46]QJB55138.1 BON domain-containing protein [Pseudodesulfovibrio sp. zrk46]
MCEKLRHTIVSCALLLIAAMSVTGCAVYPAVQVAGGAMTGYDAVQLADEYLPRNSVNGGSLCANMDKALQRRLRERLHMNGIKMVSAHVVARTAYLIGQFPTRKDADKSIEVAQTINGLKSIHCKFFPLGTPRENRDDTQLLAKLTKQLGSSTRLTNADLRVEVIRGNAILIGSAADWEQKTAAVAIAHEVGGIKGVVDYIYVPQKPETDTPEGEKVASK